MSGKALARWTIWVLILLLPNAAWAATRTWSGGSIVDNNWSTAANWSGGAVPVASDDLVFPSGVSRMTTGIYDLAADTAFRSLTFQAVYTIGGSNRIRINNAAGITIASGVTGTITLSMPISMSAAQTWTVNDSGATLVVSGIISGTTSSKTLAKAGAGTLRFSGSSTNSFKGTFTVNAGTVNLSKRSGDSMSGQLVINSGTVFLLVSDGQIPTKQVTINFPGILDLGSFNDTIGLLVMTGGELRAPSGSSGYTLGGGITTNPSSVSSIISGKVVLGSSSATARVFTINNGTAADDLSISAVVSGSRPISKLGTGTLAMSGSNTTIRAVTISAGTVVAASNNALGDTGFGTTVAAGATLAFRGGIAYSAAEAVTINGTGAFGLGAINNISGNNNFAGAVTMASASTIGIASGGLTLNGIISGAFGLTQVGTGTLTLSAANTYSGGTTVNSGTLLVTNTTGSATGTGSVTVNSGGSFGGANTTSLTGTATVNNGGTLTPGLTGLAGTLRTSALVLNSTSNLNFDLGTASDQTQVAGNLTLDGVLNVTPLAGFNAGTFTLFTYTGTLTNNTVSFGAMPAGRVYAIDTATAGQVRLVASPTVLSIVRSSADPSNAASVNFTVTFNESVTGVDSTDFTLTTSGITGATTTSVTGSGTTYTVAVNTGTGSGTVGLNLTDNNSIVSGVTPLGGAADGDGNFTGPAYTIDKTPPTVSSVVRAGIDPVGTATVDFTVTFSELVASVDTADFSLTTTGVTGTLITNVTGSGTTYTVTVNTGSGDGTIRLDIPASAIITDMVLNPLAGLPFTAGQIYTIDKSSPSVTISSTTANPTNVSPIPVTVVFTETVTGFTASDIVTSNGTVSNFAGSVANYSFDLTPGINGLVTADIPAGVAFNSISLGNLATPQFQRTYDSVFPTVISSSRQTGATNPTNGSSVIFTVIFSESVTGVDSADFSITGSGTISGASVTSVTGSGTTHTVTVNTGSGSGTLRLDVTDNDTILDLAENKLGGTGLGNGTFTFGQFFTIDKTAPTVSMTSSSTNPTNAASFVVTVTFSESVTGFTASDITIVNGSQSGFVGSGASYSFTLTPEADGLVTADIAAGQAVDAVGNGNLAAPQFQRTYDTLVPTVLNVAATVPDATYGLGAIIPIQITFNEPVAVNVGGGTPTLTLETGTTDAVVNFTSGSGTAILTFNYTVAAGHVTTLLEYVAVTSLVLNGGTIRDLAGNTAVLTLPTPGVGNIGSLSDNNTIAIDSNAAAITNVTSTVTNGTYGAGVPIPIQLTFSKSVTVTGTPQLTLDTSSTPNAIVNYTSGSPGSVLTFNYLIAAGQNSLDLDYLSETALALNGGTIRDAGAVNAILTLPEPGTTGSLGANKAIVVDTAGPTIISVTSTSANGSYGPGASINITVNLSEPATLVGGNLQVALDTGATTIISPFVATTTVSGTYTVSTGQTSADLNATSPLTLAGGATLRDVAGNNAVLVIPAGQNIANLKDIVISPTAPSKFAFTTSPQTATAGIVTGTITVQLQDTNSAPVNAGAGGQPVFLTTTSTGSVTFSPSASLTISAGSNSINFTYTDTKSGTFTLTASDASPANGVNGLADASQSVTINPASAIKLVVITAPQTTSAGTATGSITVERQDTFNNPVTAGGAQAIFLTTTSPGTITFTPSASLTIAASTSAIGFTYTDTKSGTPTITVSDASPPNGATGLADISQTVTVNTAPAFKLVFISSPESGSPNVPTADITIQLQDSFNNGVIAGPGGQTVFMTSTAGTGTFTPISPLSIPSGSDLVSFTYTDSSTGTPTMTASDATPPNGATGLVDGTQGVTISNKPSITKGFSPATIGQNQASVLTITLSNTNTFAATGASFTNTYPSNVVNTASASGSTTCGGGIIAPNNGTSVALSGGSIPGSGSCTVTVNITSATLGSYNNTIPIGGLTTTNIGSNTAAANATLTVVTKPSIVKSFSPTLIAPNATSTITFTITNPDPALRTGMNFTDTYPVNLINATPITVGGTCASVTHTAVAGGGTFNVTAGNIPASGSCTITVVVQSSVANSYNNQTSGVTTNESGAAGATSNVATLNVVGPPSVAKSFTPNAIGTNMTSVLTLTITNPNPNTVLTGIAISDIYPAGLINTSSPSPVTTCNSATITGGSAGGNSIGITGGTLTPTDSCTVTVNVTSATAGSYANTTGTVTSTNGGTGNSASATLTVNNQPTVSQSFSPGSIGTNDASLLTITLSNSNAANLTSAAFTNTYPANVINTSTPGGATTCTGGSVIAGAGGLSVALSNGTIPGSGSCTVTVNVTSATAGSYVNTIPIGGVTTGNAGSNLSAANSTLIVLAHPTVTQSFSPATIPTNNTSLLTITLSNSNTANLTSAAFTNTYPANVINTGTPNGATTCTGGSVTAGAGGLSVALSNGTIPASGSCTVTVNVTSATVGSYVNTIPVGGVTTGNAGSNTSSASATLTATLPPPIMITKTTSTPSSPQGGVAIYTITVINSDPAAATSTTITDPLPAGFFYASTISITGNNTRDSVTDPVYGNTSPTWGTFTIPATTGTLTITFTANIGCTTATGVKDNSPSVSGSTFSTLTFDGAGETAENVTVTAGGAGTMTVNSTTDTNTRDSVLTLREAIMLSEGTLAKSSALPLGEWNQVAGCPGSGIADTIVFNTTVFPPASQVVITPGSELPALTDSAGTAIDAFTAPYLAGVLLDGSGLSATTSGLVLSSNNNIVRNLALGNFGFGVTISAGFSSNEVSKNLINNARTKGILITGGSSHTIKENTVAASNGAGIDTTGSPISLTIRDNIVSSSGGAGIQICCSSPASNTILNNQVTSNAGGGIVISGGSGNIIDSNTVLNNTGGIKVTSSTGVTITKNLVGETVGIGILVGAGSLGAKIIINTVRNATSDGIQVLANTPKIFHNTLNGNTGDGAELGSSVTGFDVRNNIFSNNTVGGLNAPSGGTISHNDYFNNTGGACIGGCSIGASSITTDPLYVNPASPTYDFHLQEPNSPAINTGVHLGADQPDVNGASTGLFNGANPDMGAYESTVSGTPPALQLTVSSSSPSALSGGSAIYTVSLTNTGGTVANGVVVTATLPSGFTFLATSTTIGGNATRSPSTPDPAGGEAMPQWGTFSIPATTGTLTVTFQAGIACSVTAGTYHTSGSATSSDVTIPPYDGATGTLDDVTVSIGSPIIIVNSIGDGNVRDSFLMLREAILLANGTLSTQVLTASERNQVSGCIGAGIRETINFDGGLFPASTPGTISVSGSSLPSLTDAVGVLFDGFGKGVIIDGGNIGSLIGLTLASNTNFLRNFTVKQFAGSGANGVGILLSTASTNTLTGVTATQNGTKGIFVSGGTGNTLTSVTATLNGTLGIDVAGSSTTMTTITATSNSGGGIRVATGNTNTIATSTISSNTGIGVDLGSNSNSLTGSTLNLNTTVGVSVLGSSNTVSTNTITNSGTHGLSLSGNTNTAISTNTITGSGQRGLLLSGSSNTATANTINTNGAGGVLIQTGTGNTVTGGTIASNTGPGVRIESNSNTVSSATISSNTAGGAIVTGSSNSLTSLTMATNTGIGVEFIGSTNTLSGSTITSPTSFGVRVMTGTANTIVSCTIDGATGAGVQFESDGNFLTGGVVMNTIAGSGVTVLGGDNNAIDAVSIRTNAGAGISLTGGAGAIIQYNRIATNTGAGIDIATGVTGGTIQVNTINGNTGNGITMNGNTTLVYNNTVSHNSGSGVVVGGAVTGFDLRNNQFTFNTGGPGINAPAGGTIDYNNTYGNTPSGLCVGGCALGVNAIKADPRYASPGTLFTSSFSLNASSPAINRGLNLPAQPDLNGTSGGNFNSSAPDIGAVESAFSTPVVATSTIAELVPITVYFGSSGIPFTWDSLPAIGVSNSGVDRVNLTLPTGYSSATTTAVTVSGAALTLGTANCTQAFLPEPGEYCPTVTGQLFSVIFSNRVLDTTGNKQITIAFTLTVPIVKDTGLVFVSNVDDQMTASAVVTATAGNVNGTTTNGITDNDTLTVTTVDTVMVRNTSDLVNGNVTSAWMLVPFPDTDGISLREALTAVSTGSPVPFLDTIDFNATVFPQASPATIAITSALPTISDAAGTVISALNKTTTPTTLPAGVILDGAGAGAAGLTMTTGGNRLLGLVIQNFSGAGVVAGSGDGNEVSGMLISGNAGGGITIAGNAGKIFQNTVNNSATGVTVSAGVTGLDLRNNLITNNTTAGISSASGVGTIDFSGYFNNGSGGNVHCTGGCLIGANSIKADPRYTGAANFALLASSPAINRGLDLTTNQPDMNGTTTLNFNQGVPDLGARESTFTIPVVATSAISELIPITVYFGSSLIPFTWDIQPTVSTSQSGVDRVLLTLPAGYSIPDVTSATVSGTVLIAGTTNCTTAPNLPDTNEFCFSVLGSVLTVTLGKRVLDTATTTRITVNFTLTVPVSADSGTAFSGVVDDAMTSSATIAAPAGNANGVAANGVTDNNTLTVTTVDKVTVRNTTETINGNVTSAWMLVPFSGTDGISLREALTAVNAGPSVGFLDTIDFNATFFPTGAPATILITSALPTISDAAGTVISALNKTTTPVTLPAGVILDGATAGAGVAGLTMTTGSNRLLGLVIQNFSGTGVAMGNGAGNEVSGMLITANAGGGITLSGNNDKIFQNTINTSVTGVTVSAGVTGLDLRNNLITNNATAGLSSDGAGTIDFNGYFNNGSGGNVHCTGGCTIGANSIKADPRYTSATNFALLQSSPAINRGLDLTTNQPDMNGATDGNFNSTLPDLGARESTFTIPTVAGTTISELIPITVYFGSSGIPFTWDIQPAVSTSQSGVDRVLLTLPAGYSIPDVTSATVSGTVLTVGTTSCATAPNLPDTNEFCFSVSGSVLTITLGKRVVDTTSPKQITVNFTLTVPSAAASSAFTGSVDDAMTTSATVAFSAGNANGVAGNGVTDADTLTVTTVDKVTVTNTANTINGNTGSAALLISAPGTDGISLREALTAVGNGASFLDTIDFTASLGTITVTGSSLPSLTDAAGTIITGVGSTVQVTQSGLVAGSDGLTITAGSNKIVGMIIRNFPDVGILIAGGTNKIFHNTLYANATGVLVGGGVTGLDLRNNLITSNGIAGVSAESTVGTIDSNGYVGNGVSGNAHCTGGCLIGANSIKADPRYTNVSGFDFSLLASSPAINRGVNLGADQVAFNATGPDMGARESSFTTPLVASSALSELTPITVYFGSTGIPFAWDTLPTITATQSGVDQVTLTLPTGYSAPVVSGVTVSGTGLTTGTSNCTTAPNLPDNNEYCASVSGSVVTITSGIRVSNASGSKRITVNLTLTVPATADGGQTFSVAVDDTITSASIVAATNGNANGTSGNTITDNDTLTVTTVDKVTVRTTNDTVNGNVTSAWMLVPFPDTDGISLREALTAVNAGVSMGFLDTINFNTTVFPPATPATINVTSSPLPSLADAAGTTITALNPLAGVILNGAAGTGAGLTLSSGTNRISRLEIKNFPGNGITISGGTGSSIESSLIRSNTGVGVSLTGSSHKLVHLTINGNTGNGITNADATTRVRNSLITNNSGFGISSPAADIDYSGFFGNASGNCTGGCAIGAASMPFNPVYTNAGAGDFTLQTTSPMINMGIDLGGSQPDQNGTTTGLFNGNFPDIGRFETATGITTPSVAITKTTSTSIVNGGGPATYTITLTNSGNRGARGIAVTDTLPAGFTFTSTGTIGGSATRISVTDPSAGTGVPSWASWFIPQGGGTLTITFTAAATAPQGTYDNNVSATSIDVTITSFTGAPVQVLGYNVSGVVFSDANRNGALDLAETGIISVTVRIFAMPANSLVATQTSNSTGNYIFTGIANGSYEIRETVPANHVFTTPTILAITINNAHITGQHFGNFAGTKITGVVFLDTGASGGTPNSGVRDGGESGINAVAVKVTDTGGGTVYDQTVTSQSGAYTLWVATAITISVVVRETNPANYISTTPDTISLSASPGVDLPNNNFGDVPPLSFLPNGNQTAAPGGIAMFAHTIVAGTAGQITLSMTTTQGLQFTFYKDTNGNGQIDTGEPTLTSADLNLTANQTLKFVSRTMIPSNKALGTVDTTIITALQAFVNSSLTDTRSVMDVTTVSTGTLRLVKNGSVTTAKPGDAIVYTLTYTNIGTDTLTTIILYDRLSEYLLFVSSAPTPDTGFPDSAGVLRWTIPGTLAGGNGGSLSYTVTVR